MTLAATIDYPWAGLYLESQPANKSTFEHDTSQSKGILPSESASDWIPSVAALLAAIKKDCSISNWDKENGCAVSEDVLDIAQNVAITLYSILPNGIPCPDIMPENDGEICLSWDLSDGRIFSLSLSEHGKINYAGQLGKKGAVHGWKPIDVSNYGNLRSDLQEIAQQIVKLYH
jgi:WD40 repeat protein